MRAHAWWIQSCGLGSWQQAGMQIDYLGMWVGPRDWRLDTGRRGLGIRSDVGVAYAACGGWQQQRRRLRQR